MAASAKRVEANRRNAKKSTGPTTLGGKAKASMNALKHGLSAKTILIDGEGPEAFERFAQDFWKALEPQDPGRPGWG